MSKVVGVLSGKGGVGKTAVVANLGAAFAKDFESRAVILDANLGSSHLGMHLGMYGEDHATIKDVLDGGKQVAEAVHVHPSTGVRILPAPLKARQGAAPGRLKSIAGKLAQQYEIVIMDCPPGLGKEAVAAAGAIDSGIVVTTPDFPSVAAALKTVSLLGRMKKGVVGIVVNKASGKRHELTQREIESTCGVKVIASIPEDGSVPEGVSMGVPSVIMSPHSKASVAFKQLAARIAGSDYRPPGVLDRILSSVRGPAVKVDKEALMKSFSSAIKDDSGSQKRKR